MLDMCCKQHSLTNIFPILNIFNLKPLLENILHFQGEKQQKQRQQQKHFQSQNTFSVNLIYRKYIEEIYWTLQYTSSIKKKYISGL